MTSPAATTAAFRSYRRYRCRRSRTTRTTAIVEVRTPRFRVSPIAGSTTALGGWSVRAAGYGEAGRVEPGAVVAQGAQEVLGAAKGTVGSPDLKVEVRATGAAGVAGGEDLRAGGDRVPDLDVDGTAVAVGPADAGVVLDGDADPASAAAGRAGAASVVPPVVRQYSTVATRPECME